MVSGQEVGVRYLKDLGAELVQSPNFISGHVAQLQPPPKSPYVVLLTGTSTGSNGYNEDLSYNITVCYRSSIIHLIHLIHLNLAFDINIIANQTRSTHKTFKPSELLRRIGTRTCR